MLELPKVGLRTTDTSTHLEVKRSLDEIVSGGLVEVLGPTLSDAQWEQAFLPGFQALRPQGCR